MAVPRLPNLLGPSDSALVIRSAHGRKESGNVAWAAIIVL